MNFEELESAWAAQPATPARPIDTTELKRSIIPEFKRRGRFLGYAIFETVLCLVILPLLTVANHRYAPSAHPVWHWSYFAAWMLVLGAYLIAAFQGVKRHGALVQQSTRSLREFVTASLAYTKIEMRVYRALLWLAPAMIAVQLLNFFIEFPITQLGWLPFAGRAAFAIGLPSVIGLVFWRHYRVNLKPDHARQTELLRELS